MLKVKQVFGGSVLRGHWGDIKRWEGYKKCVVQYLKGLLLEDTLAESDLP